MAERTNRALVAGAVLALGLGVVGCGADDDNPVDDNSPITTTTTDMAETTTTSAETAYFGSAEHVGEKVTITAVVDTDLTGESVVLDASDYGDESLLVLFKGDQPEFTEGQSLTVTGTVRQFSYDDYAEEYGLAESALFEVYANEEFLAAEEIVAESSAAPTTTTTTTG